MKMIANYDGERFLQVMVEGATPEGFLRDLMDGRIAPVGVSLGLWRSLVLYLNRHRFFDGEDFEHRAVAADMLRALGLEDSRTGRDLLGGVIDALTLTTYKFESDPDRIVTLISGGDILNGTVKIVPSRHGLGLAVA